MTNTIERRDLLRGMGAAMAMTAWRGEAQAQAQPEAQAQTQAAETVYELRVYHLHPGKLPRILERFRSKETAIFARCGMTGVAYWTPVEDSGEIKAGETLVYMLRHPSREQARANWAKFSHDPEWVALKAESEKDGEFVAKIDSTFLKLTDFSPKI